MGYVTYQPGDELGPFYGLDRHDRLFVNLARSRLSLNDPPKLHHEELDAYQVAIEFTAPAVAAMDRFPRGHAPLADQLRRAAFSIPLDIAEGYGKRSSADRSRFYDLARGSAHECGATTPSVGTTSEAFVIEKRAGKVTLNPGTYSAVTHTLRPEHLSGGGGTSSLGVVTATSRSCCAPRRA